MKALLTIVFILSFTAIFAGVEDSIVVADQNSEIPFDTAKVYHENWYTHQTFAYGPEEEPAIDSTGLILCHTHLDCTVPVENFIVGDFGPRRNYFHKGIDINLNTGDPVVAAFDGKVRYAQWNKGGFGNLVIIRHPNGLETYYAHLSRLKVKPNQLVKAGEVIGLGGSTGRSYSPHLHFEVRLNDKPIDPARLFDFETFTPVSSCVDIEPDLFTPTAEVESNLPRRSSYTKAETKSYSGEVYRVKSGDCLSSIAQKHGTTVSSLCAKNGLTRNSVLQIGQRIKL
jgi:hypothetical protein